MRGAIGRATLGVGWMSALGFVLSFVLIAGATGTTSAKTRAHTFVMAKDISDIISLDPAEVFEFSGGEVIANIYDRIMMYEPESLDELVGGVVDRWKFSTDGKTISFTMRSGLKFHSGNAVTAEDPVYSLKRVVHLKKTPSFILTQFGWKPENVDELIKVIDPRTFSITITEPFSPALVLNALSAGVGSVVDSKLVKRHEKDGDWGYGWLKKNGAGGGAFSLRSWKGAESVILDRFDGYRRRAKMKRVIIDHVPEPGTQQTMLTRGDVDLARNLTPDQIKGISGNAKLAVDDSPKGSIVYMAANQTHPVLSNPKVMDALRYAIDYQGIARSLLVGQWVVHQAFWPRGLWASYEKVDYTHDLAKAKALLEEAGYGDGSSIKEINIHTLNDASLFRTAQAIQGTLKKIGIKTKVIRREGKALWPLYRARGHDLIIARWSLDYNDPHSNADAFAHNPDNRLEARLTGKLTWRNAFVDDELNALTDKARQSADRAERKEIYLKLQKKLMDDGPFVIMFQQNDQEARLNGLGGFVSGPTFDMVFYRNVSK